MPKDATVWIQPLNDTWQALGTAYRRGVWAENLSYVHDKGGPLSCSFDLRRDPAAPSPDLSAWTPCDIEINAVTVWSGRVKGTPSRDGSDRALNVQGEGGQAHLDDDQYVPAYIHTKLSDWKDVRSVLTEPAVGRDGTAAGLVTVGQGAIMLGWGKGAQLVGGVSAAACAYLDLGPSGLAKRVTITYKKITGAGGTGNLKMLVRGSDTPNVVSTSGAGTFEDVITDDLGTMSTTGTTTPATFTTARRYVGVMLYWAAAGSATLGEDNTMQISAFATYADTAYESGGASILKGSTVFKDALSKATLLFSADQSRIDPAATQTLGIPDFWTDEPRTPREAAGAANAYYNYLLKIDELRRPVLLPLPTEPALEVGAWTPLELANASQNSGEDIVNKVIGKAQTPAGEPLLVVRRSVQLPGISLFVGPSTPTFNNPSFTVDASGWTAGHGTMSRATGAGEFDTAPGGGKLVPNASFSGQVVGDITGTFKKGQLYVVSFRAAQAGIGSLPSLYMAFNTGGGAFATTIMLGPVVFKTFTLAWIPTEDHINTGFYLDNLGSGRTIYLDSFTIQQATPTLADKRGFNRTKTISIPTPMPADGVAVTQICDTYLTGHKLTPFKGDVTITGPVREILTGRNVPPERLGMRTMELLRFAHLIDPDTAAIGRDGRMVQVTYNLATDQAAISMDNTDANFEAFQARLAVFSGVGT